MPDEFDNAAFWLPQEILTDSDGEISPGFGSGGRKMSSFGYDGPLESSETESEEDAHLAELTRLLARSELNRSNSVAPSKTNSTGAWGSSGSPQSTLCAGWNGCSCGGQGSSRGSPNAYSPPPTTFDLLHVAAGEVSKMRAHEEAVRFNSKSRSMLREPLSDFAYYLQQQQQSLTQKHLQFERFRQQQILKNNLAAAIARSQAKELLQQQQQQQQQLMAPSRVKNTRHGLPGLSSSAWPPLQQAQQQHFQPNGSIFGDDIATGATPTKKESTGTGVFLPRQIERHQTEHPRSKKQQQPKKASPVFVPAKVLHALNLKAEEIYTQSKPEVHNRVNQSKPLDYELGIGPQKNSIARAGSASRQQASPVNHEIRLPQEWTY